MDVALPERPATRQPLVSYRLRKQLRRAGFFLCLFVLLSPTLFFFFWMLSLSLKPDIENIRYPPVFIPRQPNLDNFRYVFDNNPFGRYAWNFIFSNPNDLAALTLPILAMSIDLETFRPIDGDNRLSWGERHEHVLVSAQQLQADSALLVQWLAV